MDVNILCPKCHEKMIYQGGNVRVKFFDDEIGKTQRIKVSRCEKCGINITSFHVKFEIDDFKIQ